MEDRPLHVQQDKRVSPADWWRDPPPPVASHTGRARDGWLLAFGVDHGVNDELPAFGTEYPGDEPESNTHSASYPASVRFEQGAAEGLEIGAQGLWAVRVDTGPA